MKRIIGLFLILLIVLTGCNSGESLSDKTDSEQNTAGQTEETSRDGDPETSDENDDQTSKENDADQTQEAESQDDSETSETDTESQVEEVNRLDVQYMGSWHLSPEMYDEHYLGVYDDSIILFDYYLGFGTKFSYELVDNQDDTIRLTAIIDNNNHEIPLEIDHIIHFLEGDETISFTLYVDGTIWGVPFEYEGIESIEIDVYDQYETMEFKYSESLDEKFAIIDNVELFGEYLFEYPGSYEVKSLTFTQEGIKRNTYYLDDDNTGDELIEPLIYQSETASILTGVNIHGQIEYYQVETMDSEFVQVKNYLMYPPSPISDLNITTSISYNIYGNVMNLDDAIADVLSATTINSYSQEEQDFFNDIIIGKWVAPYGDDLDDGNIMNVAQLDLRLSEGGTGVGTFLTFEISDIDIDKGLISFIIFQEGFTDEIQYSYKQSNKRLILKYDEDKDTLSILDYDFEDDDISSYFGYHDYIDLKNIPFNRR